MVCDLINSLRARVFKGTPFMRLRPPIRSRPCAHGQPCILVVEDDPDIGMLLKRWLERMNVQAVLATSTREALDLVQDISFIESRLDGLLVDYQLPDATGCRVIQEFASEFPGVPIAMMTAYDDITLEGWVRSRNVQLFRKPLDLKKMEAWLQTLPLTA